MTAEDSYTGAEYFDDHKDEIKEARDERTPGDLFDDWRQDQMAAEMDPARAEPHPRVSTEELAEMCANIEANVGWYGPPSQADNAYLDLRDEREETARLRAEKDAVYAERNQVVLALARFYPHGWGIDPEEPDWRVL